MAPAPGPADVVSVRFDLATWADPERSLSALLDSFNETVPGFDHFLIRYDHCLPVLLSDQHDDVQRALAAYLCHAPYRKVTDDVQLHPFRDAVEEIAGRKTIDIKLKELMQTLVFGPSETFESVFRRPLKELLRHSPAEEIESELLEQVLLRKATQQTLNMSQQRTLIAALGSTNTTTTSTFSVQGGLSPAQLALIAVNHPMLTTEIVLRICREALDGPKSPQIESDTKSFFETLQSLAPTTKTFDLVTRLLRSNAAAPAPMHEAFLKDKTCFQTTVAHLARLYVLGPLLSNSIRHLELQESETEAQIVQEFHEQEPGLEPDRRQVDQQLDVVMAKDVATFCHFVRSLVNSALIFPPDLGSLRRQASECKSALQATNLLHEVESMEADLQSMTEATLIELKHFALRFGRYRDGTRLYSELNSLV